MNISAYIRKKYLRDDLPKGFHSLKCVYIHVPKAGGSSVCLDLFGYKVGHKKYKDYDRFYSKLLKQYFVFSIVRNPFDRLYSAYTYLSQGGKNSTDKKFFERELSQYDTFEKFVNDWVSKDNVYSWIHFVPQYEFLINKDKVIKIDYVAKLEDIDQDYGYIARRLGLGDRVLPVKNKSRRASEYGAMYTQEMKDKVALIYEKDIELFGYGFD
jgi:hypothetical protein